TLSGVQATRHAGRGRAAGAAPPRSPPSREDHAGRHGRCRRPATGPPVRAGNGYHHPHDMDALDIAALDAYPLVPRVLHDVEAPDLSTSFGGETLEWPLVPRLPAEAPWAETLIRPTGATPDRMRMAAV